MAERYPEVPLPMDPIEARIHEKFNQLIVCLNRRREQLISEHRGRQEERRVATTSRIQTIQQLTDTRGHIQTEMKENLLHSMQKKMVEEIETRMRQIKVVEREVEVLFECDTQQLEKTISVLGQVVERDPPIPNYPTLLQPRMSVGKKGTELECPMGIAFDEITQQIYVANGSQSSSGISVFSVTGEYINIFCEGELAFPVGIAINGDCVYVSDSNLHSIFHFKLPGFKLVSKLGNKGTGDREFNLPQQLTVAPNGSVFLADSYNDRVVVLTHELKFQHSISHASMTLPNDVKILDDKVFVLSDRDNPCLHVFSKSGEKLRSLITRGKQSFNQVKRGYSFCFDKQHNILISDLSDQCIKVFSREGALLHTLRYTQVQPMGIVVTNDNKIICSSFETNFGLHIFC